VEKSVILRAPVLTSSGYGVHSRQIARWLLSKDVDLTIQPVPWGMTPWILNPDRHSGLTGKMMEKSTSVDDKNFDVSIQVQLPNEWDPNLAKFNVGASAVVETDICNPSWVDQCNLMDLVIVPSNHAKKCLESSGELTTRIEVVPESFIDEILKDDIEPLNIDFKTKFNFLIVGQITASDSTCDRKNLGNTIKWIYEAFQGESDVGIIIKTNSGRGTKIDRIVTRHNLSSILNQVGRKRFPKVYLLHGEMTDQEMASLYKHPDIKCLVSLTRGEGFGLPILEAAASGLPVIATDWSGHLDFLNLGRFIPVSYTLSDLPDRHIDNQIFMKSSRWAEPSERDFKKKIKKFRKSSTIPKEWSKNLSVEIRDKFSFEKICSHYDRVLGDRV